MKKKWAKKGLALVFIAVMVMTAMPQTGLHGTTVYAWDDTVLEDEQFLDLSSLTDKAEAFSAYNLMDSENIAKIRFGKNGDNAREWLIAGEDGENTLALLSATAFGKGAYGSESVYGDDDAGKTSTVLTYLRDCMSGTAYFSNAEKSESIMKSTTVKTTDYNGQRRSVAGQLYLPDAADPEARLTTSIYIGANNDKEISLPSLTGIFNFDDVFWLRSPDSNKNSTALTACPGTRVNSMHVGFKMSVIPAFNLNLSSVIFASTATAALSLSSGELSRSEEKTYTLRYAPAEGSDLSKVSAEINKAGSAITIRNARNGMHLVVQNNAGAHEVPLSISTKSVSAYDVFGESFTSFSNCKVWIESTVNNLTYAKPVTQKTTEDIIEAVITGITAPAAGKPLDLTAACSTRGVNETAPAVTYTLVKQPVTGNAAYNRRYQASIVLTATPGYAFTQDSTARLDSEAVVTAVSADGKTMTITYTFPRTDLRDIGQNTEGSGFVTKSDLMECFGLQTGDIVGKILFGQNGQTGEGAAARAWKIAGVDAGIAGDNVVLFADRELEQTVFETDWNYKKTYSGWNCIYPEGTNILQVNQNHYGSSELRAKLNSYMKLDNTLFFSNAEKNQINPTTIYTKDTYNHTAYQTTDKLYAAYADSENQEYIIAGSNTGENLSAGIQIDRDNWGDCTFWLRSPAKTADSEALSACSHVDGIIVANSMSVMPVFDLNLSSVIFASAAKAASSSNSGALSLSEEKTYTLRYAPAEESELAGARVEINKEGNAITVKNARNGMYLVVQNSKGAYEVPLSNVTKIIPAGNIEIAGNDLENFNNCRVWIESTDDGLTYAKPVVQKTTEAVTKVAITDITAPITGEALDTVAVCNTTGTAETRPAISWTPEDTAAVYDTAYTASVTLAAAEGYEFAEDVTAEVNGNPATDVVLNPTGTITIRYTFAKTAAELSGYKITVQNDENGTAAADKATAKAGDRITLTARPAEGYQFREWQVVSGGVTITDNAFIMPESDVTIKAIFEEISKTPVVTGSIDLSKGSIAAIRAMTYTGKALCPVLTVKCNGSKLEEGSDYSVACENNSNAGTARVIVTGMGDYYGTLSKEFTINQKSLNKNFMEIKDINTTGFPLNPAVVLMDENKKLTLDTDYRVKDIKNNTTPGKAQFTLEGIGNYKGTLKGTFMIYEAGVSILSDCIVAVDEADVPKEGIVYTGKAIRPDITVKDVSGNEIEKKNYKVSYRKNKNVGTATITIKGKGKKYKGTTVQHFTILPKNIKDIYSLENVKDKIYTGYVAKQNLRVKLLPDQTGGKKTLTANTEYTISYSNAVNTGDSAVVTVTGNGNYEGSLTRTYTISKKNISKGIKVAAIKAQKYTGSAIIPELKVTCGKRVLVKGRDYNVTFANNTERGRATVTLTGIGNNYEGTLNRQFRIK